MGQEHYEEHVGMGAIYIERWRFVSVCFTLRVFETAFIERERGGPYRP